MTKQEFKAEVSAWAECINVRPADDHIGQMSRKWGSLFQDRAG